MQKDFKQHFTVFEYFLLQPQFLIISFNNQMTEKESKLSNAVRVIQDYRFINIILFHGGCKERAHVV